MYRIKAAVCLLTALLWLGQQAAAQNVSTDSRIEVRHLELTMNLLRDLMEENDPPDIEGARSPLTLARQSLAEVKNRYPEYSTAKYERALAEYERVVREADANADAQEAARAFIKKTAYLSTQLIPTNYWKGIYTNSLNDAERYFARCQTLSYTERMKRVNALLGRYPELRTDSEIRDDIRQLFTTFPQEYGEFVNAFLLGEINGAIERAYQEKKKGSGAIGAATEAANIASTLASGVLTVFPDNATALRIRKDAEAANGAVERDLGSKVYAGAFHKNNAGKVVYSRRLLTPGQEDATAVADSFTLSDNIYAVAYFKGTVAEMADGAQVSQTQMQITVFLDGNSVGEFNYPMTKEIAQATFLPLEILPALDTAKDCAGAAKYAQMLGDASPRHHTLSFRVSAIYLSMRHDLAQGEIEVDCTGGQEKMPELSAAYHKIALKNIFLPKPAKVDPALERSMVEASRGMLVDRNRPGVPVRAVVTERDWTLYRHPISGIITRRAINGAVAVKQNDGTCRFYQVTYSQVYTGAFGRLQWTSVDDGTEMDCGNIQK